jgi:hypothetical protein
MLPLGLQWAQLIISLIALGLCGLAGFAFLVERLDKWKNTRRRIKRDRQLELDGHNLRLRELEDLRYDNRQLRERIREYEKGNNIFGKISP